MSYGNHGSMYYLGKYGFCFDHNKYDYAVVDLEPIVKLLGKTIVESVL